MSGTTRTLLAVDLSNQAYKASAANPTLTSDGEFTGGLYGFLVALAKAIIATEATDIVICKDSKPYVRSLEYPQYKTLRKKSADPDLARAASVSIKQIETLANHVGWPIWQLAGFESDDLFAHAVGRYRGRFHRIYAMSNDTDLYQMFYTPTFGGIYRGDKKGVYGPEDYKAEFNLSAYWLCMYLAAQGTHNDIAGIPGIGPKRAMAVIRSGEGWLPFYREHKEILDRNFNLIELPHRQFPRDEEMPRPRKDFNSRDFFRWISRYDIRCTGPMLKAFDGLGKHH